MSDDGSYTDNKVADWHSMFQITATKEDRTTVLAEPAQLVGTGIYCDTTAAQYGRNAGLEDAKAYHLRHPDSNTVYYASLGYYYRLHCCDLDTATERDAEERIVALRQEAYIRTMNNVVHEVIEDLGGCTTFLDLTATHFEVAYTKMAARVQAALLKVAIELYQLRSIAPQRIGFIGTKDANRYQAVANRCLGVGHAACLQVLEQRVPRPYRYCDGKFRFL